MVVVPSFRAFLSVIVEGHAVPEYDRLTAPIKSLLASLSTMPLRPVVNLEVPATAMPPADCVMAPPVVEVPPLTIRLPPTLPVPRTKLPVEEAVRVPPIVSVPSVRSDLSVSETAFAPVLNRFNVPLKSFPVPSSPMAALPVVTVAMPPMLSTDPFACVTANVAMIDRSPAAATDDVP